MSMICKLDDQDGIDQGVDIFFFKAVRSKIFGE